MLFSWGVNQESGGSLQEIFSLLCQSRSAADGSPTKLEDA